eukprot:CAMPEP_0204288774 /NCGR_PEP_ID=MMETSP0468-20130131/57397_1 /ASSEMBLY_ACC=CAM_ASM_000383 /TAXON_ID=2969 /ORGANISM="Oxyrrhis marina" /LENGTH=137 /DNA_ID=CAMNT_0051266889 /DNA_START=667 /DNA_END=1076 /DNA_ORIENTATION=-
MAGGKCADSSNRRSNSLSQVITTPALELTRLSVRASVVASGSYQSNAPQSQWYVSLPAVVPAPASQRPGLLGNRTCMESPARNSSCLHRLSRDDCLLTHGLPRPPAQKSVWQPTVVFASRAGEIAPAPRPGDGAGVG